ncbi:MAG: ABC transporter permease [Anaerolineales bacterium]|nr:ABC transporter permease [Anaerolineales bacterium]
MGVATAETTTKTTAKGMKQWDSPWLNPKFLVGLGMVLFMASMAIWGPIVWDTKLARVASSPLNLPPPWAPGYRVEEDETTTTETAETEDQDEGSMTGANPFAQQDSDDEEETPSLWGSRFGVPSWDHPLGTESSGRDMLAVLLVGAPRSLLIGVVAAGIGMIVGIILGFTAGFMGGWVDSVIRTVADAFLTIPSLAVLIVISAFVALNNVMYMALLLALFAWPAPTRFIRSQVLTMRERGYVQMAQLSGASIISIMFLEMMPNLLPYLAASFTGNVSGSILAATGLEVLGLGPTRLPTLGITIFYAIRAAAILRSMWWWWGVPIVALIVIFSGLFLMTVGLDEIANPRLRGVQSQ